MQVLHTINRLLGSRSSTYILSVLLTIVVGIGLWFSYQGYQSSSSTQSVQAQHDEFSKNNRIVHHLPHSDPFYSISYDRNNTEPVTIKISTKSPYYRSKAVQYLQGFDQEVTVNHPIIFVDYTSPLEDESELE